MPVAAVQEPLFAAFLMVGSARLLNQDQFVSDPARFGQETCSLRWAKVAREGAAEDPPEGAIRERQGQGVAVNEACVR